MYIISKNDMVIARRLSFQISICNSNILDSQFLFAKSAHIRCLYSNIQLIKLLNRRNGRDILIELVIEILN